MKKLRVRLSRAVKAFLTELLLREDVDPDTGLYVTVPLNQPPPVPEGYAGGPVRLDPIRCDLDSNAVCRRCNVYAPTWSAPLDDGTPTYPPICPAPYAVQWEPL